LCIIEIEHHAVDKLRGFGNGVLMPLSTIFQLYCGGSRQVKNTLFEKWHKNCIGIMTPDPYYVINQE